MYDPIADALAEIRSGGASSDPIADALKGIRAKNAMDKLKQDARTASDMLPSGGVLGGGMPDSQPTRSAVPPRDMELNIYEPLHERAPMTEAQDEFITGIVKGLTGKELPPTDGTSPSWGFAKKLNRVAGDIVGRTPYFAAAALATAPLTAGVTAASTIPAKVGMQALRGAATVGASELARRSATGEGEPEDIAKAAIAGAIADPIFSNAMAYLSKKIPSAWQRLMGKTKVATADLPGVEGTVPVDLSGYEPGKLKQAFVELSRGNHDLAQLYLSPKDAQLITKLYNTSPTFKRSVTGFLRGGQARSVNIPANEFVVAADGLGIPEGLPIPKSVIKAQQANAKMGRRLVPNSGVPVEQPAIHGLAAIPERFEGSPIVMGSGMTPEQRLVDLQKELAKTRRANLSLRNRTGKDSPTLLKRIASMENTEAMLMEEVKPKYPDNIVEINKYPYMGAKPDYSLEALPSNAEQNPSEVADGVGIKFDNNPFRGLPESIEERVVPLVPEGSVGINGTRQPFKKKRHAYDFLEQTLDGRGEVHPVRSGYWAVKPTLYGQEILRTLNNEIVPTENVANLSQLEDSEPPWDPWDNPNLPANKKAMAAAEAAKEDVLSELFRAEDSNPYTLKSIRETMKRAGSKLNYSAIQAGYGASEAKELFQKLGPSYFSKDGGVGLDKMAELLKYEGLPIEDSNDLWHVLMYGEPPAYDRLRVKTPLSNTLGTNKEHLIIGGDSRSWEPKTVPPPDPTQPIQPVKMKEIRQHIEDKFYPWRFGRIKDDEVLGFINHRQGVIRTAAPYDISTALHEVGHYLDRELGLSQVSDMAAEELMSAGIDTAGGDQDAELLMREGVAQFFQWYALNPNEALHRFPRYYSVFKQTLDTNPGLKESVTQTIDLARRWYQQSPVDRVKGGIIRQSDEKLTTRQWVEKAWKNFYRNWVDELDPLLDVDKAIASAIGVPVDDVNETIRPYIQARAASGIRAKANTVLGDMSQTLGTLGANKRDDFEAFLVAQRSLDYYKNGMNPGTGVSEAEAQQIVESMEGEFGIQAQELYDLQNRVLKDTLVDSGVMSQEQYDLIVKKWPHYGPFYRDTEPLGNFAYKNGSLVYVNIKDPIKTATGYASEHAMEPVRSPLESMAQNIVGFYDIAARQSVGTALLKASKIPGLASIAEPVEVGKESARDSVFYVWQNGEKKYFATDPEIYQAFRSLGEIPGGTSAALKLAELSAEVFKMGVTRYNPAFFIRNIWRDSFDVVRNTDSWAPPLTATVKGLIKIITKDPIVAEAIDEGVLYSGITEIRKRYITTDINKMFKQSKIKESENLLNPATWFEFLGRANEAMEVAPKIAEFSRLRGQGYSPKFAATRAREANLDFSRKGRLGKHVNRVVPFFNAQIQGVDKAARAFAADPVKVTTKMLLYVTLPSVLLWLRNRNDPEYQEMPTYLKDFYWNVKAGDHWFRLPKPFETGVIFGSAVERSLEASVRKDPQAWRDFDASVIESFTPEVLPHLFAPWIEAHYNKDEFRDRPVVPMSKQHLPEEMQFGPYTSEVAKSLGKKIGYPPYKIDHLGRGYLGAFWNVGTDAVDTFAEKAGARLEEPEKDISQRPFLRSFMTKPYSSSESLNRFYELKDHYQREHNRIRALGGIESLEEEAQGEAAMNEAAYMLLNASGKVINTLRKQQDMTRESKLLTPKQKRERLDYLEIKMINVARSALHSYQEKINSRR